MKKTKVLLIALIISLITMISLFVLIINKTNLLTDAGLIKLDSESEQELFSYVVYDNQDENNIKILATVYSENGIEYIERDEGRRITGNGKNKIAFDYIVKKDESYPIKIKEIGKAEVTKELVVNDEILIEKAIKVEKTYEVSGYKVIDIRKILSMSGFQISYKIGENGTWKNGEGLISIVDYDVTRKGLVNEDNTITVTAKIKNSNNGNEVTVSRKYEVDTNAESSTFEADSLIEGVEEYVRGMGNMTLLVNEEEYNLDTFYFAEGLTISTNTSFGDQEDTATASSNAQNMVVLKVDGDLTINGGVTLTTVANSDGYGGPKGFLICCSGTITNNGTISMTARGAKAPGQNVYLWKNQDETYEYVPAVGAAGGAAVRSHGSGWGGVEPGNPGSNGTDRRTGGGGSGSADSSGWDWGGAWSESGKGAAGTSYSGGSGGGAGGTGAYGTPGRRKWWCWWHSILCRCWKSWSQIKHRLAKLF